MRNGRTIVIGLSLLLCSGCAGNRQARIAVHRDPGLEMFRHNWDLSRQTENHADDRVVAQAQADVLKALSSLKSALRRNSEFAAEERGELAETLAGIDVGSPFPQSFSTPERLEKDMGVLLREASEAPTWLLLQFREELRGRVNPDGMDPVRRAIIDNEIRVRQDARLGRG